MSIRWNIPNPAPAKGSRRVVVSAPANEREAAEFARVMCKLSPKFARAAGAF